MLFLNNKYYIISCYHWETVSKVLSYIQSFYLHTVWLYINYTPQCLAWKKWLDLNLKLLSMFILFQFIILYDDVWSVDGCCTVLHEACEWILKQIKVLSHTEKMWANNHVMRISLYLNWNLVQVRLTFDNWVLQ